MPHSNPGYDVTSKDVTIGDIVRYIEVKSISTTWQDAVVQLTGTQFAKAQELRDRYWLYVVENAGSPHAQVRAVQVKGAQTRFHAARLYSWMSPPKSVSALDMGCGRARDLRLASQGDREA